MTDAPAPDASVKLRAVLDYLPCEACLAQPVRDQDVLCSICRRVDRQVGVRVAVRRTVILERPSEPEPVVIQPPGVAPAPAAQEVDVVLRVEGEPLPDPRPGVPQVVLEPLAPPAAPPVVVVDAEPEFGDVVGWEPRDDAFEYVPPAPRREAPPPEPVPQDEYVFAPPPPEPEPEPPREPEAAEDWMPVEDVPLQQADEAWAPQEEPPEPQPEPEPAPVEEEVLEATPVEDEVLEAQVVEDDEVLEMEVVEDDDAAPAGDADLWRLRGFDRAAEAALQGAGVTAVAHLAGHDAGELGERTGLAPSRLAPWIQVADLVHEAGVPLDAAVALVTAGIAGPRGLREAAPDALVERVHAFGGRDLSLSDVKRWKRRV